MKPVDIAGEREKRAGRCMFCGDPAHQKGPFTCSRISGLTWDPDDGSITGASFWSPLDMAEFYGEDPDDAA